MAEEISITDALAILLPDGWHEVQEGTGHFVKYRLQDDIRAAQNGYVFTERARAGTNLCVRADAILAVRYGATAANREPNN